MSLIKMAIGKLTTVFGAKASYQDQVEAILSNLDDEQLSSTFSAMAEVYGGAVPDGNLDDFILYDLMTRRAQGQARLAMLDHSYNEVACSRTELDAQSKLELLGKQIHSLSEKIGKADQALQDIKVNGVSVAERLNLNFN